MKRNFFITLVAVLILFPTIAQARYWTEYFDLFSPAMPLRWGGEKLEEALPGLVFTGFLRNRTCVNLHQGDTGYKFSRIEWLEEVEVDYKFNPTIDFTIIGNYLYDSLWSWTEDGRDAPAYAQKNMDKYHLGKRILRELWLRKVIGNWSATLGKQQVVWGKVDGRRINDMVNPEDMRYGYDAYLDDLEFFRITQWMANFTYDSYHYNFQLLIVPDYETSESASPGANWAFKTPPPVPGLFVNFLPEDKPADSARDMSIFVRAGFLYRGWDVKFIYGWCQNYNPAMYFRGATFDPVLGGVRIDLEPRYVRLEKIGFDLDKTFDIRGKNFVFKTEAVYTRNLPFSTTNPSFPTGIVKLDYLVTAFALEFNVFTDWGISITLAPEFTFNDSIRGATFLPSQKPVEPNIWGWAFTLSHFFACTQDRLLMVSTIVSDDSSAQDGWDWRTTFNYQLTDFTSLYLALHLYGGEDWRDIRGQWKDNDEVEMGIRWNF